jgi:antitoxin Phd
MKSYSAVEARNHFSDVISDAQKEPVRIEKNGRPAVYVISKEDFERYEAFEDAYWATRADLAGKDADEKGWASFKDGQEFMKEMLKKLA